MSRRRLDGRLLEVVLARVQPLEPRLLFNQVAWDGDAQDGLWNTPLNWSNDRLPALSDEVTIDGPDTFTVTLAGAQAAVASLILGRAAGGGTQTLVVLSKLTLGGATAINATGSIRLDQGGVLGGDGDLDITQGQMDWLGGAVEGGGAFRNQGSVQISGPATKTLRRRLENLPGGGPPVGTLKWTGGGDVVLIDGAISNRGVMNVSGAGAIKSGGGDNYVYTGAPFDQSGNTFIEVPFHSTGDIREAVTSVGGRLTLSGGGESRAVFDVTGTLVLTGAAYQVLGVGRIRGTGTARFEGGAHRLLSSNQITPARLEVRNGGTNVEIYEFRVSDLVVSGGGTLRATRGTARTATLSIDVFSRLDLTNSGFIIDYAGGANPLASVRQWLTDGYARGAWNGNGISSSAAYATGNALGYAESGQLFASFPTTFLNEPIDDTAVLIRPTRYGDADLDALVNFADLDRLAQNFGTSNGDWSDGDFTFDRSVTLADFNRLAAGLGPTMSVPGPPRALPNVADDGTLRIEGTAFSDTVGLTVRDQRLRVRVNGRLTSFRANDVTRVEIRTSGGDDVVDWSGSDVPAFVDASAGDDTLTGGTGDDALLGGDGNNVLFGGGGHDLLKAGAGADTLIGEGGYDRLRGGPGHDRINGGDGKDRMWGQDGNDRLYGRRGNDALDGGPGSDQLFAHEGSDRLFARDGEADSLNGGDGEDSATVDAQVDTLRAIEDLLT